MNPVFLMPLLPLAGWLVLVAFGKHLREPLPGWIASGTVLGSFGLAVAGFLAVRGLGDGEQLRAPLWEWLPAVGRDGAPLVAGFALDPLSSLMTLIITGVGFLIHVFAVGYMHGDKGFSRFFAHLNLFVALMLVLVLGDSYPVMFVGWEGVGVASYLLIGFWYTERANGDAARKAFVINRIGDLFFLLAMFLIYRQFGTLVIRDVREAAGTVAFGAPVLELIGLFLLLGAAGKSAQLPFSTWLPDAMAGPTPVSALIHAATMVTAGVYLVARSSFVFANAPDVSAWVAWVGAFTALFGAFSALAQTDIKRILAYSTVSQLGLMFVAAGSGAYWVALFHVTTHAFFKALLFLSSGSVIHALGGEQDVRRMGGLRASLPLTNAVSLVGTLAIAGVPILAGFWSKDAILTSAFASPFHVDTNWLLWGLSLAASLLTAVYMWRWYSLVFLGRYLGRQHPHESPAVMTVPLLVLAALSAVAGFVGLPPLLGRANLLEPFLERAAPNAEGALELAPGAELGLIAAAVAVSIGGILVAALWIRRAGTAAVATVPGTPGELSRRSLLLDEAYAAGIAAPARAAARGLAVADELGVTGGFAGLGAGLVSAGDGLRTFESGFVRAYAVAVLVATAVLLGAWALRGLA